MKSNCIFMLLINIGVVNVHIKFITNRKAPTFRPNIFSVLILKQHKNFLSMPFCPIFVLTNTFLAMSSLFNVGTTIISPCTTFLLSFCNRYITYLLDTWLTFSVCIETISCQLVRILWLLATRRPYALCFICLPRRFYFPIS